MRYSKSVAFFSLLICCLVAAGKNRKKIILPEDVLEARTVLVIIDPDAGIELKLETQTAWPSRMWRKP